MDPRTVEPRNSKMRLGFNICDVFSTKDQTKLGIIMNALDGETMKTQYNVKVYRINLYFYDYKLAIEIYEYSHVDRNTDNEEPRRNAIEKKLGCDFIRINTDESGFNIFKTIKEIHTHIKKSSKESFIDNNSGRLLELRF